LPWIYGKKDFARYKERILFESGIHPDKAVRVLNTEYFFVNASSYDEPVSICDFKVLFNLRRYPEYNQYTLISTPRRWGKTTSVGIFVASVLFSVPESWISVYSTGRRASKALSDLVYKFVMVLEETAGYTKTRVIVKVRGFARCVSAL
jgi:hypothetical protein